MSAARVLTMTLDELRELLEQSAELGAERALDRARKRKAVVTAEPVVKAAVSDTDRALARKYSRDLGLIVKDRK